MTSPGPAQHAPEPRQEISVDGGVQLTHFLDLPLFLVIVYCGAMRPDSWRHVLAAIAVALVATVILAAAVRRLIRPS